MRVDIEYIEKNIYFYNVIIFINRIKNIVKVKKVKLLKISL